KCRRCVGCQAGVYLTGLDDGIAHVRQPVEALADIQCRYGTTLWVGRSDKPKGFQPGFNVIKLDSRKECVNAVAIKQVINVQEPMRSAKHHQADIDALASFDIRNQTQDAVEVRHAFTHVADPGSHDPDRLRRLTALSA